MIKSWVTYIKALFGSPPRSSFPRSQREAPERFSSENPASGERATRSANFWSSRSAASRKLEGEVALNYDWIALSKWHPRNVFFFSYSFLY